MRYSERHYDRFLLAIRRQRNRPAEAHGEVEVLLGSRPSQGLLANYTGEGEQMVVLFLNTVGPDALHASPNGVQNYCMFQVLER